MWRASGIASASASARAAAKVKVMQRCTRRGRMKGEKRGEEMQRCRDAEMQRAGEVQSDCWLVGRESTRPRCPRRPMSARLQCSDVINYS